MDKNFFEDEDQFSFVVYLRNTTNKVFQKSFDLFFSPTEIEKVPQFCNIKTKLDVIREIGFPSSIVRKEKTEFWYFDVSYIGDRVCGYDSSQIVFKNSEITQISGSI